MGSVDPRLNQIPKELLQDFEVRNYFEQLERFLHDLWVRTGAGDDIISTTLEDESAILLARNNAGAIKRLREDIDNFPLLHLTSKQTEEITEITIQNRYKRDSEELIMQVLSKIKRIEQRLTNLENEQS